MSKDSMRAAKECGKEVKATENTTADEKVVCELNEEDSAKHAEFLELMTKKFKELFAENKELKKSNSSIKTSVTNLKKSVESNTSEINELKKRIEALGIGDNSADSCCDYKLYIDEEISKRFECTKSYVDEEIKKRFDEVLASLPDKAEEPEPKRTASPDIKRETVTRDKSPKFKITSNCATETFVYDDEVTVRHI